MTGYGKQNLSVEGREYQIEIKSVNHRYLDINVKIPKAISHLEETIKKEISNKIKRGKIDVFVSFEKNSFFDAGGDASQINNINLYTIAMNNSNGDGKSGSFDIGTLIVKPSPDATDVATISFQNTKFAVETSNNTVDGNVTLTATNLTISSNINSGNDNENTSTDNESTNSDTNTTSDNNDEKSTDDKKTSDTISNPKTGVYGGSILLIASAICGYFVMKKKNYFNKI